jgi:hypothetical protein
MNNDNLHCIWLVVNMGPSVRDCKGTTTTSCEHPLIQACKILLNVIQAGAYKSRATNVQIVTRDIFLLWPRGADPTACPQPAHSLPTACPRPPIMHDRITATMRRRKRIFSLPPPRCISLNDSFLLLTVNRKCRLSAVFFYAICSSDGMAYNLDIFQVINVR